VLQVAGVAIFHIGPQVDTAGYGADHAQFADALIDVVKFGVIGEQGGHFPAGFQGNTLEAVFFHTAFDFFYRGRHVGGIDTTEAQEAVGIFLGQFDNIVVLDHAVFGAAAAMDHTDIDAGFVHFSQIEIEVNFFSGLQIAMVDIFGAGGGSIRPFFPFGEQFGRFEALERRTGSEVNYFHVGLHLL